MSTKRIIARDDAVHIEAAIDRAVRAFNAVQQKKRRKAGLSR